MTRLLFTALLTFGPWYPLYKLLAWNERRNA